MSKKQQQTIRAAIVAAMADQAISQSELARRTGITQPRVNQYLTGKRDACTETADKMLAVLGLKVE